MKWIRSGVFLAMAFAAAAQTAGVRTVYVLPMSGGLDLFVAQWLAKGQTVHVTTDPKSADAILTDHLGEDFEHKLDQLLAKKDEKANSSSQPERYSPGRHRGTVFLVDPKTHQVLWSDYEKPPTSRSSDKLNHEAQSIAKKLSESLGGKPATQGQRNGG
jgi:hypothetical protein